jgi:hypothetical protein
MSLNREVLEILGKPFDPKEVEVKIQAVNRDRTRAQVVAYVDARTVLDRLDETVGPTGWSDSYEVLTNGTDSEGRRLVEVKCTLTVLGVSKEDVGEGDSLKAAFSDALKRAAVKFGVGRYLYRLPKVWADLDERGNIKDPEAVKRALLGGEADDTTPWEDKPPPRKVKPAEPEESKPSGGVTEAQLRYIHKLWKDMDGGDDIHDYASAVLNREVSSLKELTRQEASKLIEVLKDDFAKFNTAFNSRQSWP